MISNGTLQDGCDERHDVRFRKRWRCLLRVKLRRTQCEQMSSGSHLKADIAQCRRHVSKVPTHKVAALQPAAREQEPRGRQPVERTAIAGVARSTRSTSVLLAFQQMIKLGSAST